MVSIFLLILFFVTISWSLWIYCVNGFVCVVLVGLILKFVLFWIWFGCYRWGGFGFTGLLWCCYFRCFGYRFDVLCLWVYCCMVVFRSTDLAVLFYCFVVDFLDDECFVICGVIVDLGVLCIVGLLFCLVCGVVCFVLLMQCLFGLDAFGGVLCCFVWRLLCACFGFLG